MKITLVQCPAWTIESPPYSLALLAAALKKDAHQAICFDLNIEIYRFLQECKEQSVSIINAESWSMDFRGNVWYDKDNVLNLISKYESYINRLVESILKTDAPIIGFSVQSTSKFFSLEIARRIKEKDKKKIIIFGGPLCFRNCYGIDILKDFLFLDFVCFGEGEETLPWLLNNIENIINRKSVENLKGFGYRLNDGTVIDGGDSQFIKDLNEAPFADYSGFSLGKYTKNLLPIATSRGCINRCSFCNESTHWLQYRKRSAVNIFSEIKYQLEKFPHIKSFWFNDSLINGDIKMLNELCDLLISNKIEIKWGGQGIIRKEITKDFLRKMKLAGCNVISYGVENGSNKILRLMRKGYTNELAEKIIGDTYETGIGTIFNIIIGFPGETEIEFKENKQFIERCRHYANTIALNLFLLLKHSYVYNNLEKFNISPIDNNLNWQLEWKTKDGLNTYSIRKDRLEELLKLIREKSFYAFS